MVSPFCLWMAARAGQVSVLEHVTRLTYLLKNHDSIRLDAAYIVVANNFIVIVPVVGFFFTFYAIVIAF